PRAAARREHRVAPQPRPPAGAVVRPDLERLLLLQPDEGEPRGRIRNIEECRRVSEALAMARADLLQHVVVRPSARMHHAYLASRQSRLGGRQKVFVTSSATRMTGGPPVEMATACATAFCADVEAAAVCRAAIEGK